MHLDGRKRTNRKGGKSHKSHGGKSRKAHRGKSRKAHGGSRHINPLPWTTGGEKWIDQQLHNN